MALGLATVGVFILVAGSRTWREDPAAFNLRSSAVIGIVQALCLPVRGFSRSGATISTGLCAGMPRQLAEEFSFALAVVITPPLIVRELLRLLTAKDRTDGAG